MKGSQIILVVVIVFVGIGIFSYNKASQNDEAMMVADDSMMTNEDQMMGSGEEMTKGEGEMMEEGDAMMKAGAYEAYAPEKLAKAESGDVVLFFRASWCPTCQAVDKDIKANLGKIPSDLTILDVDYDNSSVLKKKYAVTYQHTFVQVDKDGNQLKKWNSSPTLDALVAEVI